MIKMKPIDVIKNALTQLTFDGKRIFGKADEPYDLIVFNAKESWLFALYTGSKLPIDNNPTNWKPFKIPTIKEYMSNSEIYNKRKYIKFVDSQHLNELAKQDLDWTKVTILDCDLSYHPYLNEDFYKYNIVNTREKIKRFI